MRDFNYFEPYITVNEKPDRKKFLYGFLVLVAVLMIGYYHYLLITQVNALKADLKELDSFVNDSSIQQKVSEVELKQNTERELNHIYNEIVSVKFAIDMEESVNALLVDSVNTQMPEDVFITQLSLAGGNLSLSGYSKSMEAISQFGFNLRHIGPFDNIDIPTVTESNGQYQFAIYATWTVGGTQ